MRRLSVIPMAFLVLLSACVVIRTETRTPGPAAGAPGGGEAPPQAEPATLDATSDRRLLGSLGWALLSPEVSSAVIEIDQLGGEKLGQEAIDAMRQALVEHGGKKTVDVVVNDSTASKDVYSLEDLVATAQDHRDRSSGGGTVALHVLVLPGRFEVEGVPGAAFHATSIALFPEAIRRSLPGGAAESAFEVAVAVHELGHTFGLVNRTGVGDFHEDPDHPGHTADEDSVMYWAIESPSLTEIFRTGPPRSFNDADRQEMEMIRGQRP